MDCIRKIVLSVVFSLGIISCTTTRDYEGKYMSESYTASCSDYSITMVTDRYAGYTTKGTLANVCDKNDDTYFYLYMFSQSQNTAYTTYTITPSSTFVATFRIKMHLFRDNSYWGDYEQLTITVNKTNGKSELIYDSTNKTDINIDENFAIYSHVNNIVVRVKHYGLSPKVYAYAFDIKRLSPSKLYACESVGKTIRFLDDDIIGSDFKYKDKDGVEHSVFLVEEWHPLASRIHVKTKNGLYCLARMP